MKELRVLLTLSRKFISVNALYGAKVLYKGGKPIAAIYKNPEANRIEEELRNQLRAVDFSEDLEWLRNTKQFELHLKFIFKTKNNHRDCSNAIKNLEDIWTRFVSDDLGIEDYDDSMHVKVTASKALIPGADHEYAVLVLRESRANLRYDIEPKPENIWVSGWDLDTITNFLPPLPKRMLKKEKYLLASEYDKADTKIYILEPTPFQPYPSYLVAEIYRDVLEAVYSESGFVMIGIVGEEKDWEKREWESIEWLKKEVEGMRNTYKGVFINNINSKEDILEWIQ